MARTFTEDDLKKILLTLPKRLSSATIILETSDGRAIVEKAHYKSYWTFPGGVVDPGETPRQTAVREAFEELGIVVDPDNVRFVAVATRTSDIAETYQFIFHAPIDAAVLDTVVLQSSEIESWDVVTKQQAAAVDKVYSKAVAHWAEGNTGYIEQSFGDDK